MERIRAQVISAVGQRRSDDFNQVRNIAAIQTLLFLRVLHLEGFMRRVRCAANHVSFPAFNFNRRQRRGRGAVEVSAQSHEEAPEALREAEDGQEERGH